MKNYLNNLSEELRELIHLASDTASQNNMKAYLVGGFVRDLILGVKNLDLDIVIEGDGIRFAEILSEGLQAKLIRHRRFGTATVILKKHLKVDIATSRKETYPEPAQLPDVTCGTLKDDLIRRDFTINAMAISINSPGFGKFIDCFNGKKDLEHKNIRILHDLSFIDDPTRILRAIRFEQRYNFRIEIKTLRLLKEAVRLKMLNEVSPHRLRDELILILKEEKPLKPLRRIQELTGFSFISKSLSLPKKTALLLNSISQQIHWFRKKYPKRRQLDAWLIYLMGLIDTLDTKMVKSICRKFAFRKGEEKRILTCRRLKPGFLEELSQSQVKASRVFNLLEPLSYEAIIFMRAKSRNPNTRSHIRDFFAIYNGTRIHLSGQDLHNLGLKPGPSYQKIFSCLLNARLNGLAKTREDELALIKKLMPKYL